MNSQQLMSLAMPVVFIVVFYLLLIRPQQKRDKQLKQMRNELQIGDEVVTIGGIFGRIMKVTEDSVVIEVGADKTKIPFERWAIGRVAKKIEDKSKKEDKEESKKESSKVDIKKSDNKTQDKNEK